MLKNVLLSFLYLTLGVFSFHSFAGDEKPLPVPGQVRVASSEPRKQVWNSLSECEKRLAFHLLEAARSGKAILVNQSHRHGLVLKRLLENSLSEKFIGHTKRILGEPAFSEYLNYAAKFEDMSGPYESSNRKYVLDKVSATQLSTLIDTYIHGTRASVKRELIRFLKDPEFEVAQKPENETGEGLEKTGGNLYAKGITGAEVAKAFEDKILKGEELLNCRVVRGEDGKLTCEKQTIRTPGPVGNSLRGVVYHLAKAREFASTEYQKQAIDHFIRYFETGDIEEFRQANIAWVRDRTNSKVDFMIGFVEVYEDYLAKMGSWESYVQIVDPETTKTAAALAKNAQYFEDKFPYGKFKKKFPKDYSPPAIMVYYLWENSSYHTGGYNLPNFDDIRNMPDAGAKNVIRLDLPGADQDETAKQVRKQWLEEFLPASKVDAVAESADKIWRVVVLLHEITGHGSGTYDTTKYGDKEDPVSALGALGSALEEQRADQTALVLAADSKLVEIGIYKDQAEALRTRNLMYDYIVADFLRRLSKQRTVSEAHQRGHWLLVKTLLDKGVIGWVAKDESSPMTVENQVLAVKDYDKFHEASVELLGELQRIKANRDEQGLKTLFETKAPLDVIQSDWAKAIIKRGEKLLVNNGYVEQPWRVNEKLELETFGGNTVESIAPHWKKQ